MLSVLEELRMSSVLGVFDNNKDNWNTQEKINAKLISDVLKDVENCPTGNGKKHHTPGNVCNPPERGGPDIYLNQTSGHPTLTSEGVLHRHFVDVAVSHEEFRCRQRWRKRGQERRRVRGKSIGDYSRCGGKLRLDGICRIRGHTFIRG